MHICTRRHQKYLLFVNSVLTFRTVYPVNRSALAGLFGPGPQWYDNEHG